MDPYRPEPVDEQDELDTDEQVDVVYESAQHELIDLCQKILDEDNKPKHPPTSFVFEEEQLGLEAPLYKDYEKINLYRDERQDSPFAGVDRIKAHFTARDRERVNRMKQGDQPGDPNEEMIAFFQYLEKDPGAKRVWDRFRETDHSDKDHVDMVKNLPLPEKMGDILAVGKEIVKEQGGGSEYDENMKLLENLKKPTTGARGGQQPKGGKS